MMPHRPTHCQNQTLKHIYDLTIVKALAAICIADSCACACIHTMKVKHTCQHIHISKALAASAQTRYADSQSAACRCAAQVCMYHCSALQPAKPMLYQRGSRGSKLICHAPIYCGLQKNASCCPKAACTPCRMLINCCSWFSVVHRTEHCCLDHWGLTHRVAFGASRHALPPPHLNN